MFFSKDLYFQGIKKIRTTGIGFAAIVLSLNFLYALSELSEGGYYIDTGYLVESIPSRIEITGGALAPFTILMFFFSYRMVTSMFSFLSKRNGSDFFHSIPYKRICVYLSLLASVCTWIVGIVFATILINSICFASSTYHEVSILHSFLTFLGYSASFLVVAGVTAVCRMVSGTSASCFLYTVSFFAAPRFIVALFKAFLESFNPTIDIEKTWLNIFSLEKSLYFTLEEFYNDEIGNFGDILLLVSLFVEALLLFALAAFFYVKRKSETAEKNEPSKTAQLLFRTAAVTPILCFGIYQILDNSDALWFFILSAVALLVYFIFDLIISKNLSKTAKSIPLFAIPILLSAGIIASSYGIAAGFKATNPELSEIESFEFFNKRIEDSIYNIPVDADWAKEIVVDNLNRTIGEHIYHYRSVRIKFNMKDGSEKFRKVYFETGKLDSLSDYNRIVEELELLLSKKALYEIPPMEEISETSVSMIFPNQPNHQTLKGLSDEFKKELIKVLSEEYASLSAKDKIAVNKDEYSNYYWDSKALANVYLTLDKEQKIVIFTDKLPKTASKLIEYYQKEYDSKHIADFINNYNPNKSDSMGYSTNKLIFDKYYNSNFIMELYAEEARLEFYNSLDEKKLGDFSDLSKVYVYWGNDEKYHFISLTDKQIKLLNANSETSAVE